MAFLHVFSVLPILRCQGRWSRPLRPWPTSLHREVLPRRIQEFLRYSTPSISFWKLCGMSFSYHVAINPLRVATQGHETDEVGRPTRELKPDLVCCYLKMIHGPPSQTKRPYSISARTIRPAINRSRLSRVSATSSANHQTSIEFKLLVP